VALTGLRSFSLCAHTRGTQWNARSVKCQGPGIKEAGAGRTLWLRQLMPDTLQATQWMMVDIWNRQKRSGIR